MKQKKKIFFIFFEETKCKWKRIRGGGGKLQRNEKAKYRIEKFLSLTWEFISPILFFFFYMTTKYDNK